MSFDGLCHLYWNFLEVDQHAYWAGWGCWVQAGSIPCDQKFSCKWNLSFFRAVPSNKLLFYLGSPLHIISSLFSQFWLFQNAILNKILKLLFWNFKPIFLRIQFSLDPTFFCLVFVIYLRWYLHLKLSHEFLTFI